MALDQGHFCFFDYIFANVAFTGQDITFVLFKFKNFCLCAA